MDPGTMMMIANLVGQGVGAIGDTMGAKAQMQGLGNAQSAASREASRNRRLQQQMLAYMRGLMEEGKPTRQAQYQATQFALPRLQERAMQAPGTGLAFQRNLGTGMRNLSSGMATYGVSPDSSAFSRGAGELTGNLMAADENQILGILQFLSGQAPNMMGAATQFGGLAQGYGQQSGNMVNSIADLMTSQGAVQGGMYSSLGNRFGNAMNQVSNYYQQNQQYQQLQDLINSMGLNNNYSNQPPQFTTV